MDEKPLDEGTWPFGYFAPKRLEETSKKELVFVADDHPIRDEDIVKLTQDTDTDLAA